MAVSLDSMSVREDKVRTDKKSIVCKIFLPQHGKMFPKMVGFST